MQNGTVATEISGTMATETILSYWHCITEMTGTTCSEMGGTVATELSSLTELRVKRKLSFRQLAALCDVDHSDIQKYESGEVNPTMITIVDLAIGLNVRPKELLDFDVDFLKKEE